ncbi:neuropeptide CCHamide-1 receptor-like isoform X3 [Andrena cerasifolii]|uniref:neuropeptide CCHamide-1 receptor-like isoform X3 n=1 Tax=Andrena cerasifolii TaxID=2819439 RepID=UPI0040384657
MGTMSKAYTTVSPLSAPWATQASSSILRVTSGIASTTHYAGSVYGVINQTMLRNETDDEGEDYTPYGDRPETYIVPIVFLLILLIGLTGNGVLALTILRHSNMRNVPNIYVFSLALGDLLVIVTCVPFTSTAYILDSWPFGLVMCKVSECVKDISVGVSVFTLTALSADRFFAIVDPMRKLHATGTGRRATRFTVIVASLIWLLAIFCAIPASFSYIKDFRVNKNVSFRACYPFPDEFGPNYSKTILVCRFFIYYAVPLSIIAVFYILMARHLMHSTRNIPGEMQGEASEGAQKGGQDGNGVRDSVRGVFLPAARIHAVVLHPPHRAGGLQRFLALLPDPQLLPGVYQQLHQSHRPVLRQWDVQEIFRQVPALLHTKEVPQTASSPVGPELPRTGSKFLADELQEIPRRLSSGTTRCHAPIFPWQRRQVQSSYQGARDDY